MSKAPDDLRQAALAVLAHSYSPYSKFKVACALRCDSGAIYSGCNIENGSYSLTLCAEASAIAAMASAGDQKIVEALILVDESSPVSPCGSCRQRLHEFSDANTLIHMCTVAGNYEQQPLTALLPYAFILEK